MRLFSHKPSTIRSGLVRSIALACLVFALSWGLELWLKAKNVQGYWGLLDNVVAGLSAGIVVLAYEWLRQRTVKELFASEMRFRQVVEHIADALFVDDVEGRVVFANDQFLKLFGLRREQLQATTLEDYVAPEYRAVLRERHDRRISGQPVPTQFEYEGIRQDGTRAFLEVDVVPVINAEGKIIGTQSALRDITTRKRAEAALRESEEISRTTFEQAAIGVAHVDIDGRWIRVNDKLCSILGYSREELLGLSFAQITYYDDLGKDLDYVRKVLSGDLKTYSMEKRYIRKDQSLLWANLTVSLVRTSSGEPKYFIAVVEDIAARKQAEEALHQLSGQLISAQERERSWISKELHDGIGQNLALLAIELDRIRSAPERCDFKTDELKQLSSRVKSLSDDIRTISHGLHPSHLEYLGLASALHSLCSEVNRSSNTEVQFEASEIPRKLPHAISLCLYRVVQEALQNVIRHSEAKHTIVEIKVAGDELHLRICDDGTGFDPAACRQADSIGLMGMRERVGLIHGEIRLESKLGQGTVVEVRVPLSSLWEERPHEVI